MITERSQTSSKKGKSPDSIKDKITLIIGLSGLLLWLVVKAITTINFNEYDTGSMIIKPVFLVASFSFTVSILIGMLTYYKTKSADLSDPSKGVMSAVKWFLFGLFSLMIPIPLILSPEIGSAFTIYLFALTYAGKYVLRLVCGSQIPE